METQRTPTRITIGRSEDNDVVLSDEFVSRHHAEVHPLPEGTWEVVDRGSRNGTFVDERRIARAPLEEGQVLSIGQTALRLVDGRLVQRRPDEVPALQAHELTVFVDGSQKILDDVSFSLQANSLLAIVGPTGAGKTTLLRALTGFHPPDNGDVYVQGHDLYASFDELRRRIGYVPQEEILHPQLTIRKALRFAARLRFGRDLSRPERSERVEEVMAELGLADRADLPIARLSGGQRKRTNLALELLSRPSLLFLDEPTSGLDPGFERSVMEGLRNIGRDGRAVVVVTHVLQSLDLCDQVLFVAPGGRLAFYGPPSGIVDHFGTHDYAQIFSELQAREVGDAESDTRTDRLAPMPSRPAAPPKIRALTAQAGWFRQLWTLVRRQLAIIAADRRNLLYLGIELLLPALLILALVEPGALEPGSEAAVKYSRILIAAVVVSAVVIGAANAIREIVKETPVYLRDRAVGTSRSAYLVSKLLVLGMITVAQVLVLTLIAVWRADGPQEALVVEPPVLELAAGAALAGAASVALGLFLSSLVSTSEKAMALIPVVFVVQWLFSGVAIDLADRPVLRQFGFAAAANWGVSASAASVDLCELSRTPGEAGRGPGDGSSCDWRWEHERATWALDVAALGGLTLVPMLAAARVLSRKEPDRLVRVQQRRRRRWARRARSAGRRPRSP